MTFEELDEDNTITHPPLKIGDQVWKFDENRRVYDKPGMAGRVIYREHWCPMWIIGENRRSWILWHTNNSNSAWGSSVKAPKTGPHPGFAFSEAEVDDDVWLQDHRHSIIHTVERLRDVPTLRKVAALVGWAEAR